MRSLWVRRPSPALVISVIALVVALGGTSYAAFSLPSNSVGAKQLRNGAVTNAKIKNGAVTKAKLSLAGVVAPSATNADHAQSADNAVRLGGQPATAYLGSNALLNTGLRVLTPFHAGLVLLRNGPLSLTANCDQTFDPTHEYTTAAVVANSSEADWLSSGIAQSTFSTVIATDTGNNFGQSGTVKTFDLETPSGAMLRGQVTIAENWPVNTVQCTFNAYSVS
jgi:hypothetical protein